MSARKAVVPITPAQNPPPLRAEFPTVEHRLRDMRNRAALLFSALDGYAAHGEGRFQNGAIDGDALQGFADVGQELYREIRAVEDALTNGGDLHDAIFLPAPDREEEP